MFKQPTTIIVGAGASCELGLPSGEGLKLQIIDLLRRTNQNIYGFDDEAMQDAMRRLGGDQRRAIITDSQPFKQAAEAILKGLPLALSIDNFLHTHRNDDYIVRLGKLCIAICIARAERKSHFFASGYNIIALGEREQTPKPAIINKKIAETWYPEFVKILFSGHQNNELDSIFRNIKLIVFNYDRCLEQYLWMSLQRYFNIDEQRASEVMSGLEVVHPYGSLGKLPWNIDVEHELAFGGHSQMDPWLVAERIKTFTESVESEISDKVRLWVQECYRILSLGFGFLDQNVQLLRSDAYGQAMFAISTAYGVSRPDQVVMQNVLSSLGPRDTDAVQIESGSCRDLFANFRLTLDLT